MSATAASSDFKTY